MKAGDCFGELTLTIINVKRVGTKSYSHYRCSCGREIDIRNDVMSNKKTFRKNCGKTHQIYTGAKFYNTTVMVPFFQQKKEGRYLHLCKCDCGKEILRSTSELVSGRLKSCGCKRVERIVAAHITHGCTMKRSTKRRLYNIWSSMKERCVNPLSNRYRWYGGKGISVCSEWLSFQKFAEWAYKNGYDDSDHTLSIDRVNSDGIYCPENCQWIPLIENSRKAGLKHRKCRNRS